MKGPFVFGSFMFALCILDTLFSSEIQILMCGTLPPRGIHENRPAAVSAGHYDSWKYSELSPWYVMVCIPVV